MYPSLKKCDEHVKFRFAVPPHHFIGLVCSMFIGWLIFIYFFLSFLLAALWHPPFSLNIDCKYTGGAKFRKRDITRGRGSRESEGYVRLEYTSCRISWLINKQCKWGRGESPTEICPILVCFYRPAKTRPKAESLTQLTTVSLMGQTSERQLWNELQLLKHNP